MLSTRHLFLIINFEGSEFSGSEFSRSEFSGSEFSMSEGNPFCLVLSNTN